MMVGRTIYEEAPQVPERADEVVLEVRGLSRGRAVRDVSFELRRGEILGVAGLVGAGPHRGRPARSSAPTGRIPARSSCTVAGRHRAARPTPWRTASAICPRTASAMAWRSAWTWRPTSSWPRCRRFCQPLGRVDTVGPARRGAARRGAGHQDPERPAEGAQPVRRHPAEGRHRQVAHGRDRDPHLRRADPGHRRRRQERDLPPAQRAGAEGKSIIMISSELPEILRMSHRIIVMCEGRMTGELSGARPTRSGS